MSDKPEDGWWLTGRHSELFILEIINGRFYFGGFWYCLKEIEEYGSDNKFKFIRKLDLEALADSDVDWAS